MDPDPRATVIEIFRPGGFSADYQVPAEVLGFEHYGIWNDRCDKISQSSHDFKGLLGTLTRRDPTNLVVDNSRASMGIIYQWRERPLLH